MSTHFSASRFAKSLVSVLPLLSVSYAQASVYNNEQEVLRHADQYAPGFTFSLSTDSSVAREATVARVNLGISVPAATRDEAKTLGDLERAKLGAYLDTFPTDTVSYFLGSAYDIYEYDEYRSRKHKLVLDDERLSTSSVTYTTRGDVTVTFQTQADFRLFADAYANSTTVTLEWVWWSLAPAAKAAALRDLRHQIVREAPQVGADYAAAIMPNAHFRLAEIAEESMYENSYGEDDNGMQSSKDVEFSVQGEVRSPRVHLQANVRYKFVMDSVALGLVDI